MRFPRSSSTKPELRTYSPVTSPRGPIVCKTTSRLNENCSSVSRNLVSAAMKLRMIVSELGELSGGVELSTAPLGPRTSLTGVGSVCACVAVFSPSARVSRAALKSFSAGIANKVDQSGGMTAPLLVIP